jgi:tRNA modification GTPase
MNLTPLINADTICAVATPGGTGGVGIIRVSGPGVADICQNVIGKLTRPRHAKFSDFLDASGTTIDSGIVLYFPAPHSFTGEDVLELQAHGGPVILNLLLKRVMSLGARLARPGEFSERAFLNDKLDLAQAEAIADLIESGTEASARAAQRSLQGVFSSRIAGLLEAMVALRVHVEAAIDFPDEEIDFIADPKILSALEALQQQLAGVQKQAHQGQLLRDGLTLAIIGRPNAGKSSLLNALTGRESAIVTEVPGTTRDLVREQINMDGLPLHLIDTAGIRDTGDLVEAEGVRRARESLLEADLVLLVVDVTSELVGQLALKDELPTALSYLVVFNKTDLGGDAPDSGNENEVWISAKTGSGLDRLKAAIRERFGIDENHEGTFSARSRHLDALDRVSKHLESGHHQLKQHQAGELLAEELRQAQHALGEITGKFTNEDMLGAIFSSFCIGK